MPPYSQSDDTALLNQKLDQLLGQLREIKEKLDEMDGRLRVLEQQERVQDLELKVGRLEERMSQWHIFQVFLSTVESAVAAVLGHKLV